MLKNKKLVITLFLIVQVLITSILKNYPEFVEQYYSHGVYVFISKLMRYSFGWLPISVGDILYTLASIYIIRWFLINRKRIVKDTINWLLDIGAALSMGYFAFHLLWAYNYYREPLYHSLKLDSEYTTEELLSFTKRLIEKSNAVHSKLATNDSTKVEIPFSKSKVFEKVTNGYDNLAEVHPQFFYNPKSIKKSIYSLPLTYMGFSGYLNPFTNEAQVDGMIPTYKFPSTSCHEVAHQIGYAAENEANFIGSLAAIHNDDLYFQYSGYTFGLRHCLVEIFRRDKDTYYQILKGVNKGILKNYQEVDIFWKSYTNPLEPVFEKTYDAFLKSNNQSAGMSSYSDVVALLVNYYENRSL